MCALLCGGTAQAQGIPLLLPSGVAADAVGDLYIADTNRHQVLKVDTGGAITVVAGTGVQGFTGDGGAATQAELDSPMGVAVGADGTIYISDTHNQRVRVVDASGVIRTMAGTGRAGFGGDGGAATAALLHAPGAMAVGADGTVYIADTGNQRVRCVHAGVMTTMAGDGVQGFSGDGGPATQAELDAPSGVVLDASGNLYIADMHNQRIRFVDGAGVIHTLAGNGANGFGGDGGVATQAALALPRGLSVDAAGDVIFADSGNQRVRMISPSGNITTMIGDGTQGFTVDGATAAQTQLDSPRAVAIAGGVLVVADSGNGRIREATAANSVYTVGGQGGMAGATAILSAPSTSIYGSGMAEVTMQTNGAPATGTITLLDGANAVSSATLSGGSAAFPLAALTAGVHSLAVRYSGDALHPSALSNTAAIVIAPLTVTATANTMTLAYGQALPPLSGTLQGELAADAANLSANFTTQATAASAPGTYPIVATLGGSGAGNYTLVLAPGSGNVIISQTQSAVSIAASSGSVYEGQPITLTANVASTTTGVPTGNVTFYDGNTALGNAVLVGGIASFTTAPLTLGTHAFVAAYRGDADFMPGATAALTESVLIVPDFSVSPTGSSEQAVDPGGSVTFNFAVQAQAGSFPGAVQFAVTGLPPGATATFAPSIVIPGANPTSVSMMVKAPATAARTDGFFPGAVLGMLLLPWLRRRTCRSGAWCGLLLLGCMAMLGCGVRTSTSVTPNTYSITVTASGSSVTNTLLQHATTVSLTVN